LWRCGDGLFFEVPPLASDALLTTLHPLLENVLQTVCRKLQEDSGTGGFLPRSSIFMAGKVKKSGGARSELNSVFGFEKVDRWNPIRTSAILSRSRPMRFLGFSNHEKGTPLRGKKTACSTILLKLSANGLQHIFEKWMERGKKCVAC
jgi:hypothetical protein